MLALRRQNDPTASLDEAKNADRKRPGKGNNEVWRSPTDPEARVMVHADQHTALSYRLDATVDLETGVIVAAGARPADEQDQESCLQQVDEAVEHLGELGLEPSIVVADKGHHAGENLAGLEERGLIPLVSAPRPNGPEGFRLDDFTYDEVEDRFLCPAGELLTYRRTQDNRRIYRPKGSLCRRCPHFGQCTRCQSGRTLTVPLHQESRRSNAERVQSEAARPLMMIRRQRGERPFSYFKQYGGLRRLMGRGLAYAEKKALVAACGWNLLLLVKGAVRSLSRASREAWWRSWVARRADLRPNAGLPGRRDSVRVSRCVARFSRLPIHRRGALSGGG